MNLSRNFLLLWQGLTTSSLGTNLFSMVSVLWLMEVANSASLVGLLMLALGISTAVFTPIGGVLADRFSRRNILVVVDLCSGLTILILAGIFILSDTLPVLIIGLFATQIILGVCSSIFMPSVLSLLPNILPGSGLAVGNAVMNITMSVTQVIGRGFGGLLFSLMSSPLLLIITGVCFLVSAVSELFIQTNVINEPVEPPKNVEKTSSIVSNVFKEIAVGVNYILANKGMVKVFFLQVGLIWCLSTLTINTPFLVQYHFSQSPAWYGYLFASLSMGLIVGSIFAGKQFNRLTGFGSRVQLSMCSLVAVPLPCIGLTFTSSVYTALPLFFLQGVFQSIGYVTIITLIQAATPDNLRGRVVSLITMISAIVFAGSSSMVGFLIDAVDKDVILVQWLLGIVGCLLIYPVLINKHFFHFIRYSPKSEFDSYSTNN
jgi:MFS family permease